MAVPTDWSNFIYPPQQSTPLLNFNLQDAVNVSWATPSANMQNFDTLELVYWWSAPVNAPFALITNETVPLNGSRVFSVGFGQTFPAVGFFALFYMLPDGSTLNGPSSLGFNVTNIGPSAPGRLWSQNRSDTTVTNPTEPSTTPSTAPTTTVTLSSQATSGSATAEPSASGLSAGAIVGIVVGVAVWCLAVFLIVLFFIRRRWRRRLDASNQETFKMQERFEHAAAQLVKIAPMYPAGQVLVPVRLEMDSRQQPWGNELHGDSRTILSVIGTHI